MKEARAPILSSRIRVGLSSLIIVISLLFTSTFSQTKAPCSTSDQDDWIEGSLSAWKKVRAESLKLKPGPTPWLILFDEHCVYHINPVMGHSVDAGQARSLKIAGERVKRLVISHTGVIALPENGSVPARLMSFAAPYAQGERSFLVSALPSIWQSAPHLKDEKNVSVLARSIFMHEMTHTLHRAFYGKLDLLEKRLDGPDEMDDDIVQETFREIDDFRTSVDAEKQLLFDAATSTDRSFRLGLARRALKKMTERRKKYFTKDKIVFAELEDVFLTMEGVANWAAFRAALDQGMNESEALALIRRGGKYWSQDLGLAIFLTIDKLHPDWQKRAFSKSPATALELLSKAVE